MKRYLCRSINVEGELKKMQLVETDDMGKVMSVSPFVRETPSTVWVNSSALIINGKFIIEQSKS